MEYQDLNNRKYYAELTTKRATVRIAQSIFCVIEVDPKTVADFGVHVAATWIIHICFLLNIIINFRINGLNISREIFALLHSFNLAFSSAYFSGIFDDVFSFHNKIKITKLLLHPIITELIECYIFFWHKIDLITGISDI